MVPLTSPTTSLDPPRRLVKVWVLVLSTHLAAEIRQERSIVVKESSYDYDDQQWLRAHPEDLWVFDKLILSRVLGYTCGPVGLDVPRPDFYCVRPITNVLGMGRSAEIIWISKSTDHLPLGHFWCEVFDGAHLSVDYEDTNPVLSVIGEKDVLSPLYRWNSWRKVDFTLEFPELLKKLKGNYKYINCEFIGDNLIEVHFRRNPDFKYGNSECIPVWKDSKDIEVSEEYIFIEDSDYHRMGIYIK